MLEESQGLVHQAKMPKMGMVGGKGVTWPHDCQALCPALVINSL